MPRPQSWTASASKRTTTMGMLLRCLQWSHGFQLRLSAPTKQCNRFSAIVAQDAHVSSSTCALG